MQIFPKIHSFLLLMLFFAVFPVFGQRVEINYSKEKPASFGIKSRKALDYLAEGQMQMQYKDFYKAIDFFQKALEIEPNFDHAHLNIGVAYFNLNKFEECAEHLEAVENSPFKKKVEFSTMDFYLAESYFNTNRFAEALPVFERFIASNAGSAFHKENAKRDFPKAQFAAEAMKNPVSFKPINLGTEINSQGHEYFPFLSADDKTLIFTSRRPENMGEYNKFMGDYLEDLYISEYKDGKWTAAKNLGAPVNSEASEGTASITQDGRMIFFAAELKDSYGGYDIYYATKTATGWSKPINLGEPINSRYWESQPYLSHDGKHLYFSSLRTGGFGKRDIWVSHFVDGKWQMPENLGNTINTPGDEQCPFIHADGQSLYFSSDYHPGFGNQDLFLSYYNEDKKAWETPKNLGFPLNTTANEGNIFVNTKGNKGYINSTREGGYGMSDLYEFVLDEKIRPKIATFLRGITRDSASKVAVQAKVYLIDVETRDTLREMFTGKADGKFLMSVPLEREYAVFAEAPGYIFASKNFYLKNLEEDIYFDVVIDMEKFKPTVAVATPANPNSEPEKPVTVILQNVFFESGKYDLMPTSFVELDVLFGYMEKNPKMKIEVQGHTDNVGGAEENLALSQNRANAVRDYLLGRGIEEERIISVGYGESQPIETNDTPQGRAKNRRTAFVILAY